MNSQLLVSLERINQDMILVLRIQEIFDKSSARCTHNMDRPFRFREGPVAGLVGIEGGVVSGVFNLESSGVEASDWRPRHDEQYHEA